MKPLIVLLVFVPFMASAQQTEEQKLQTLQHYSDSLAALVNEIDLMTSQRIAEIQSLTKEIEAAQLRKENEELRQILKGYILQIEELNTLNLQLERELDVCRNKNGIPEKKE